MLFKNKKSIISLVLLSLLLVVSVFVVGCGNDAATEGDNGGETKAEAPETIELKVAHIWPSAHPVETFLIKGWAEALDEATDGQVKITTYPGGTLLTGPETYQGVVEGVADVGISVYAYTRGRFPVLETAMLPGLSYDSAKVASKVATELIKKYNPEELQDTKQLMTFSTGPGHLLMQKTVRTQADLKGLEIGATAGPRGDALAMLGATPVTLPMPEAYEAMSRGVIQGIISAPEALQGFKLGELIDSMTITPFLYNQLFFMVMNKEKWDSIPPDLQETINQVTADFYEKNIMALWDGINDAGLKWTQDQKEVEILELPKEELARWKEIIKPLIAEHQAILDGKGLQGEEIINTTKELVEQYNNEY